ncbi:MAG TPA: hypothetical protein VNH64_07595 [Parvularculaceae bacterium]|nr:hypothetical protein [Parvularculaceae bacterium]
MELRRDEIAFRKQYQDLVLDRSITTVFRPGNRIYPNWRGYKLGEMVTARIIDRCGSDELNIPPLFNEHRIIARIASLKVTTIDDLRPADFEGSSPDIHDIESLEEHLKFIYRRPVEAFNRTVTRIGLVYALDQ